MATALVVLPLSFGLSVGAYAQQQPTKPPAQTQPTKPPAQTQPKPPAQTQPTTPPVTQTAPPKTPAPVLAMVDFQVLLRDSLAMQGVRSEVEVYRKKFDAEIAEEQNKVRVEAQQLQQQRSVLAPAAFSQKQEEIQRKIDALTQKARGRMARRFPASDSSTGSPCAVACWSTRRCGTISMLCGDKPPILLLTSR